MYRLATIHFVSRHRQTDRRTDKQTTVSCQHSAVRSAKNQRGRHAAAVASGRDVAKPCSLAQITADHWQLSQVGARTPMYLRVRGWRKL